MFGDTDVVSKAVKAFASVLVLVMLAACAERVEISERIVYGDGGSTPNKENWGRYPMSRVTPGYPPQFVTADATACVVYVFTVTADGRVRDVLVLSSSDTRFDPYGAAALRRFRYRPFIENGQPVDVPDQTIRLAWEVEGKPWPDHEACG